MSEKKLKEVISNLQPMPFDLGDPDPDMELVCLHCGKMHKPFNHMYAPGPDGSPNDYAYMSFCSDKCFKRYYTWRGTLRRFLEDVVRYLVWWPMFFIKGLIWRPPMCPKCNIRMETMIGGSSWHCTECWMMIHRWGKKYDYFGDFEERLPNIFTEEEMGKPYITVEGDLWDKLLPEIGFDTSGEYLKFKGKEVVCLYCEKPVKPEDIGGYFPKMKEWLPCARTRCAHLISPTTTRRTVRRRTGR